MTTHGTRDEFIDIEVVFALPGRCWRVPLRLPRGTTTGEAQDASGLDFICQAHTAAPVAAIGVFGRKISRDQLLADGDRIELYRRLVIDPRQRRRERAAKES